MSRIGEGAVVLVTGGTSGIGLALVEALHARGVDVRFCARKAADVAALQARLLGSTGYVCDVTDAHALAALAAKIEASAGRLDVLIASVGGAQEADFAHAPLDEAVIRGEIELNLISPVLTVNRLLPLLARSQDPHIVIVGSGFGWSPSGRLPIYSAAKAGVRAFAKSLRAQLDGVHVMELVPPVVDTPAVAEVKGAKLAPSQVAQLTLTGLDRRREAVFPGSARMIPLMLRLAPGGLERITLGR